VGGQEAIVSGHARSSGLGCAYGCAPVLRSRRARDYFEIGGHTIGGEG